MEAELLISYTVGQWDASARCEGRGGMLIGVGVHTGDPVVDDEGRFFGMSVVVAARLCAVAQPGQVLVSDVVRALVAPRGTFEFEPAGDLTLKGVGEPVTSFVVRHDLIERAGFVTLPPPIDIREGFGFVGRHAELERLQSTRAGV